MCYLLAISELGRIRWEDGEFEASLDYMARPWGGDDL